MSDPPDTFEWGAQPGVGMVARESQDVPRRIADLDGQDAYALLGIEPDARPDEIVAAYRREMARAHPDRGGSGWHAQLVNCAFDVLTKHREIYDELCDPGVAGPEVVFVEPDVEPLDDPILARAGHWWIRPGVVVGAVAVLALIVVVAFFQGEPAADPATGWTVGELDSGVSGSDAPGSDAPGSDAPGSDAATARDAAAPAAVAPPASSWSVSATVVIATVTAPASGGGHHCEVRGDGSLWCWGTGLRGELGDAGRVDRATPVRLGSENTWSTVSVGQGWTCAVRQDQSRQCWGSGRLSAAPS